MTTRPPSSIASSWRRSSSVVPGQGAPAQIDARRDDQTVIGQPRPICQRHRARLRIDTGRPLPSQLDAVAGQLVERKFLGAQLPQPGDDLIAERAGGEHRIALNKGHRDAPIEPLQRTGATGAGKASADDDNGRARLRPREADGEHCTQPKTTVQESAPRRHCAAYQAAIAAASAWLKPLAMRSITVAGRCPARNCSIAVVMSAAGRPMSPGTGVSTPVLTA